MRENGAEIRRLLLRSEALRFGERPAGAVKGALGDDMLALAGVLKRAGMVGGGGILFDEGENVKGLKGMSETSLLLFFEGELKIAGSTFSLSTSSNVEGSNGLLVGENRLFEIDMLALSFTKVLCAKTPILVSMQSCQMEL